MEDCKHEPVEESWMLQPRVPFEDAVAGRDRCRHCGVILHAGWVPAAHNASDPTALDVAVKALMAASTGLSHAIAFCAGSYAGRGLTQAQIEADPIFQRFLKARDQTDEALTSIASKQKGG